MLIIKAIFKEGPDLYRIGDSTERDDWLEWPELVEKMEELTEEAIELHGTEEETFDVCADEDGQSLASQSPLEKTEIIAHWLDLEIRELEREGFADQGRELIGMEFSEFGEDGVYLKFSFLPW